mmetsp:Transcript_82916/g.130386  ORF Transcript_82916/g.130386 Transcript_82916/m.130386 type:complete len:406 (+) Transcript_82916:58-1275(+)
MAPLGMTRFAWQAYILVALGLPLQVISSGRCVSSDSTCHLAVTDQSEFMQLSVNYFRLSSTSPSPQPSPSSTASQTSYRFVSNTIADVTTTSSASQTSYRFVDNPIADVTATSSASQTSYRFVSNTLADVTTTSSAPLHQNAATTTKVGNLGTDVIYHFLDTICVTKHNISAIRQNTRVHICRELCQADRNCVAFEYTTGLWSGDCVQLPSQDVPACGGHVVVTKFNATHKPDCVHTTTSNSPTSLQTSSSGTGMSLEGKSTTTSGTATESRLRTSISSGTTITKVSGTSATSTTTSGTVTGEPAKTTTPDDGSTATTTSGTTSARRGATSTSGTSTWNPAGSTTKHTRAVTTSTSLTTAPGNKDATTTTSAGIIIYSEETTTRVTRTHAFRRRMPVFQGGPPLQ